MDEDIYRILLRLEETKIERFKKFIRIFIFGILPLSLFVSFIVDTLIWVRGIELHIIFRALINILTGGFVGTWFFRFFQD